MSFAPGTELVEVFPVGSDRTFTVDADGKVTVDVACTVSWSDLGLPTAQSRTLTATGTAPIDTWTER